MNKAVVSVLSRLPRSTEFVFTNGGKPLGDFRDAFQAACCRAGIEDGFRVHDLRHTFATAAGRTIGQHEPQAVLGHTPPAMTARYSYVSPDHLRVGVNAISVGVGADVREGGVPFMRGRRKPA